jgi:hypothetical protein
MARNCKQVVAVRLLTRFPRWLLSLRVSKAARRSAGLAINSEPRVFPGADCSGQSQFEFRVVETGCPDPESNFSIA